LKPSPFVHHLVRSIDEAVAALAAWAPEGGRILAGGQSLVPMMAFRLAQPTHLIDINRIPGISNPAIDDNTLVIPAGVRHAAFHRPMIGGKLGALLAQVVAHIAHGPIRNRGTFCGSIANADPSAEWGVVLTALDGLAIARDTAGRRMIEAADFYQGIMTTALREAEMLTAIHLPILPHDTRFGFSEHSRRAGDYAQAMTLATWQLQDGRISHARVAVGGVEPCPRRLAAVEALLEGREPGPALLETAADAAAAAIAPMTDGQISASLRRNLLRAVTRGALRQAAA
jgi:carbon-monoxide dehydrogenase medium subunit